MKPVIFIDIPGLPTEPPKMDVDSRKVRIEEMQEISKPFLDEIGKRLIAMGITKFRKQYVLHSIVVFQDVSEKQIDIIKSWKEVKSVGDGDTPIHLI